MELEETYIYCNFSSILTNLHSTNEGGLTPSGMPTFSQSPKHYLS